MATPIPHRLRALLALPLTLVLLAGCETREEGPRAGPGVDLEEKVLYVGTLNDESGPAQQLGRPFALGTRILVHQINSGQSDLLPEGWRVRLIERDHGYNPERAVEAFQQTHERVLFYVSVFGTPNILAIRSMLSDHEIVAFPTSSASILADNQFTPPPGPSDKLSAQRAMDWVLEELGDADGITTAVVYQEDDYGRDGYEGWMTAAEYHGVEVVAELGYQPGQDDFSAIVAELAESAPDAVFMATLPGTTARIVGGTAATGYRPLWVGNAPSWTNRFFAAGTVPDPTIFDNYHLVSGFPTWGEDEPFVQDFMAAFEDYTQGRVPADPYILIAYIFARVPFEAFGRALDNGDVTRRGYLAALQSIADVDLDGALPEPLDLTRFPYVTGTQTRILKPDFEARETHPVTDYARPRSFEMN